MNTADTDPRGPLVAFREAVYHACGRRADALFDLLDALSQAGPVDALAALSLHPAFRRGWGSVYAALARGRLAPDALRAAVAAAPLAGGEATYAVDTSVWARTAAKTSAERGYYYHADRHLGGKPVVAGWSYQWIAQLGPVRESWTAPLDVERVPPSANVNPTALAQIRRLLPRLPAGRAGGEGPPGQVPVFVFDAGYDPVQLTRGAGDLAAGLLVRLRATRCFYADPPPPAPGQIGRRRQHGAKFACADPASWPTPDAEAAWDDPDYGRVAARAWAGLHPIPRDHPARGSRARRGHVAPVRATILRVEVAHLPGSRRPAQVLWLWWAAPPGAPLDLARLWRAYAHRFDLEHTFRFLKQRLDWTLPHVRTPEQADRWSWLVLAAYTQLRLARPLVADPPRLPWQRAQPAGRPTPRRVQQGLPGLLAHLGSPARAVQPCGRSPGRPLGRQSPPATRHPVLKKTG